MEKIRFITDSASDMNHPREDVTILPLHIRFGDDEYADGVTISHREFYEKLIECDTLVLFKLVLDLAPTGGSYRFQETGQQFMMRVRYSS